MLYTTFPKSLELPAELSLAILNAAAQMAKQSHRAFRIQRRTRGPGGRTLRPGGETPLWNMLRMLLRPHLRRHGDQANLARLLGLPRQRVHAFLAGGSQMPDAERTLQLLAWLAAVRQGRPPS